MDPLLPWMGLLSLSLCKFLWNLSESYHFLSLYSLSDRLGDLIPQLTRDRIHLERCEIKPRRRSVKNRGTRAG